MSTYESEPITAAVRIAELTHLLRCHALGALRDASRQLREASEQIGRILDGAGASVAERVAAIDALGLALTTLTVGAVAVEAQACACAKEPRVSPDPTPEEIESAYIERGHKPLRKVVQLVKPSGEQCYAGAHDLPPRGPKGAA